MSDAPSPAAHYGALYLSVARICTSGIGLHLLKQSYYATCTIKGNILIMEMLQRVYRGARVDMAMWGWKFLPFEQLMLILLVVQYLVSHHARRH